MEMYIGVRENRKRDQMMIPQVVVNLLTYAFIGMGGALIANSALGQAAPPPPKGQAAPPPPKGQAAPPPRQNR